MDEKSFVEELTRLSEALEKLLGKKIIGGRKDQLGLIGFYYGEIEGFHLSGNVRKRNAVYEKLKRLFGELICAQIFFKSKRQEYRSIVRKLTSPQPSDSLGARAELMMLSFLMEDYFQSRSIELTDIQKGEASDYTLRYKGETIYFEITSAHTGIPKSRPLTYKIATAINKKAKKSYANKRTAVFLDVTNVFYRDLQAGQFAGDLYRKVSYDALSSTNLGGVVLMLFGF